MTQAPKIQFTPAQAAAIGARGGSLLVSAAAGSGKTRVLVERAVGLMTDPQNPVEADELLIMTFTTAAAAKLRADLSRRLSAAIRQEPHNARLRRQQMKLQRASIGTVDAFCLRFVQQNFAALEIAPDFAVGDDAVLTRIRQEALSDVLERAYRDPDFRAFADLFDRGRSDATAGQAVQELYDFAQALPRPAQSLRDFAAMWQSDAPPEETDWGRELLRTAQARTDGALRLVRTAQRIAARDPAADKAYTAVLLDDEEFLCLLAEQLARGDWDAACGVLASGGGWRRAGSIRGGKAGNLSASAASALRDRAKEQVKGLSKSVLVCTAQEFLEDRRRAAPLIAALVRTTEEYARALMQAKQNEKVLDYADLEHMTLELLLTPEGERTALCRMTSARCTAVLVDEYQDTNALQDAIYFALAAPDASNLFFVGDIKQSIYGFRQTDPSLFIEKQLTWKPYPASSPVPYALPSTVALDANFRSAPGVIEGINYLFETVFSQGLGGIDYGVGQRLVVGTKDLSYAGRCELDVLRGADPAADARFIARRIARLTAQGFAVRSGAGETRPCGYGDFCILLRTRGQFELYQSALAALNIPAYADVAADLLKAPHVRPFTALLRVLDNPAQDVELSAVLLSPLYPYTPDDLVRLRAAVPKGSLYAAVLHGADARFQQFLDDLTVYQGLARTMTVGRLMEELLARTGYLAAVGAMPDGARCRDDLLDFTAWASQAGARGLSALVRAMDAAVAGNRKIGGAENGQPRPGCVTIMTVHRSKGLEFPIVFVANTTHEFNTLDTRRPVLHHRRLGLGLTLRAGSRAVRYETLPYAALKQRGSREMLSEEMRILYVALTRAQDALFITVPIRGEMKNALKKPALLASAEAADAEALMGARSWADWLLVAALLHPDSDALWSDCDFLPHHRETNAPLAVRLLEPPPAEAARQAEPAVPDAALADELCRRFAWQNPNRALESIPVKVSVSAVTHARQELTLRRPAFLQKNGLTGAERGTAIHAFLQSVPFGEHPPELQAEVQRQLDQRLLDPALAEVLDLSEVRPFFESKVWRRIAAAERVLREEPFITALPAAQIVPEAAGQGAPASAQVLVQGIADVVLVFADHAEILDYKTDRSRDPAYYTASYAAQLRLYRRAFAVRLPVPVTKLTIYSFSMQAEVDIPL